MGLVAALFSGVGCASLLGASDVPAAADDAGAGVEAAPSGPTDATEPADVTPLPGDAAWVDVAEGQPDAASDACIADLSKDPFNCGACGHVCETPHCAAGLCAPTVVAASLAPVSSIAADGQGVYFASGGDVFGRATGGSVVDLAPGVNANFLAIDAVNVFFTGSFGGGAQVAAIPRTGGSVVSLASPPVAAAIALDDRNVYYTGVTPNDELAYVPKDSDGSAAPTQLLDASALSNCLILAAQGGSVYFVSLAQLYSLPRAGGVPANLQAGGHYPNVGSALAVDVGNTAIAWSGGAPNAEYAMLLQLSDHGISQIANTAPSVGVGLDSEAAYALVGDPNAQSIGSIVKVPRDGSAPTLIAKGLTRPVMMAMAVDAFYVVAQDPSDGTSAAVLRVAR